MPKYCFVVTRIAYHTADVVVDAADADEAYEKVDEMKKGIWFEPAPDEVAYDIDEVNVCRG